MTVLFRNLVPLMSLLFLVCFVPSKSSLLGVHPLDEKYFAKEVIRCKAGSRSFTRDRLNDNFCDCFDGTDEPGTSACPAGKFYCRNVGSTPQFIFSSRVNDLVCDCCDGSDEYDSSMKCPNTCVMGGNIEYKTQSYISTINDINTRETKITVNKDLIEKLKEVKMVIVLQVVLCIFLVVLRIMRRRAKYKRRHSH